MVIQTAFIGDVILATGILEKLHQTFPDSQLDFLVRKGNESLLKDHPFVKKTLVWDKRENKWGNMFRLIRTIRSEKYDLVVNLQRYNSSAFITLRSGAKHTSGYASSFLSAFFDKRIEHKLGSAGNFGPHEIERNHQLIAHLCPGDAGRPALYPSKSDYDFIKSYSDEKYITISPASVWFTKQVPSTIWVDLIRSLNNQKIFLLGGPGDQTLCTEIISCCPNQNVISLAGKLSLLQSAALMKSAAMNYTNDSAPLHLCSAMNAPVTAVFCSTIPEFGFGPLSDISFIVQHQGVLECKPCGIHGYKECPKGHFKCGQIAIPDLLKSIQ